MNEPNVFTLAPAVKDALHQLHEVIDADETLRVYCTVSNLVPSYLIPDETLDEIDEAKAHGASHCAMHLAASVIVGNLPETMTAIFAGLSQYLTGIVEEPNDIPSACAQVHNMIEQIMAKLPHDVVERYANRTDQTPEQVIRQIGDHDTEGEEWKQ